MHTIHNLVAIHCETPYAAARLARKISNKWSEFDSLNAYDSTVTLNAQRYILRYAEKQPECSKVEELLSVSISK